MNKQLDLVVIGAGTAAMGIAKRCRSAGWSVAVADFRPFGGTCALRGCDPKKVLVGGASAAHHARRMYGKGIEGDLQIAWSELIDYKWSFTDPVPESSENGLTQKGIETLHGQARFTGRNSLEVGGERLEFRHAVIASGAKPVDLDIPGAEHLITHEEFLELDSLLSRLTLVGGGYIAAEFFHIAARSGAEVTILQRVDPCFPLFRAALDPIEPARTARHDRREWRTIDHRPFDRRHELVCRMFE